MVAAHAYDLRAAATMYVVLNDAPVYTSIDLPMSTHQWYEDGLCTESHRGPE